MSWQADINARKEHLRRLARMCGTRAEGGKIWAGSPCLILHYDLITIRKDGSELHRSRTYDALEGFAQDHDGEEMSESVYAIPIPRGGMGWTTLPEFGMLSPQGLTAYFGEVT